MAKQSGLMPSRDFSTSREMFSSSTALGLSITPKSGWRDGMAADLDAHLGKPSKFFPVEHARPVPADELSTRPVATNKVDGIPYSRKNRRGHGENALPAVVERNRKIAGRSATAPLSGRQAQIEIQVASPVRYAGETVTASNR